MAQEPPVFGAVLVGSSFGITNESFSRVDAGHWTLDVSTSIRPDYENIKEICVFLLPQARDQLPADCALGIYVSACGSEFEYRGAVSIGCPSVTLPLAWPQKESQQAIGNATASIGISIEPLASLAGKEDSKLGDKEEFAKRVAMDLYRYMESFQSTIHSSTEYLMVPQKVIEVSIDSIGMPCSVHVNVCAAMSSTWERGMRLCCRCARMPPP